MYSHPALKATKMDQIKKATHAWEEGDYRLFNKILFDIDWKTNTGETVNNYTYELWKLYITYHKLVYFRYIVNLESIKVKTLEWTLPSPPPAHTFAIAPKSISTSKKYLEYRKGARLYKNYGKNNLLPVFAGVNQGTGISNDSINAPHINVQLFISPRKSNAKIFGSAVYDRMFIEQLEEYAAQDRVNNK